MTEVNSPDTAVDTIIAQMNEPRPLPLGRKEFEEWSERIISGACIPGGEDDKEAFIEGQKSALCQMIMSAKPAESHIADAHFIHSLRKAAANQVAAAVFKEFYDKAKERTAIKETQDNV